MQRPLSPLRVTLKTPPTVHNIHENLHWNIHDDDKNNNNNSESNHAYLDVNVIEFRLGPQHRSGGSGDSTIRWSRSSSGFGQNGVQIARTW